MLPSERVTLCHKSFLMFFFILSDDLPSTWNIVKEDDSSASLLSSRPKLAKKGLWTTLSLAESQRLLGLQECGDLQFSSFAIFQRWTTGKIPIAQHLAIWSIVGDAQTRTAHWGWCWLHTMADAEGDSKNMPSERRNMPPGIWSLRFPSRCYGKWSDKHIPGAPAGRPWRVGLFDFGSGLTKNLGFRVRVQVFGILWSKG